MQPSTAPPAPSSRSGTEHRLTLRVYYEDTDFSGAVYHAGYLRFMERGRTEMLRAAGIDQSALFADGRGLGFAVRRITVDYLRPARMDDLLTVETRVVAVRGASLDLSQRVLRADAVLVGAVVQVAAVAGGRSVRIPEALRRRLSELYPSEGR